jgi:heterodisulfide reductase subunit D
VFHISEFLVKHKKNLVQLLSQLPKQNQRVLAYHDPCHLGRELGIYEQPRRLIHLVPGTHLKEFSHNREQADCCGGGGALPKTFPSFTEEIAQRRLDDTSALAVEMLVSACPNCKLHFANVHSRSTNGGFEILDLMELLARALKVPTKGR